MSLGLPQLLLVLVLILIVFGAGKLPKVMGDLGKGVRSLKEGMSGDDEEGDKKKESTKEIPQDQDSKKK